MSQSSYDVVIVGTGPGGSVAAAMLAKAGLSVLAIEKEPFPRFHIGESLTGTAGLIIRELGLADDMERLDFPDKPGVTVIGSGAESEFFVPVLNPTWQVRRSSFDRALRDRAAALGARIVGGTVTAVARDDEGKITEVEYLPRGGSSVCKARGSAVIDASGQSVFLSSKNVAGPRKIDSFGRQIAFFSHFEGVRRDRGAFGNNTTIFYSHVNHWAWVIPISPTVDSLGIVMPVDTYRDHGRSPEAALQWGLANINPELTNRFASSRRVEQVRACRDYSYSIEPFVGPNWLCVGDAHRFVDPIFSYGVSFAMTEARRASDVIVKWIDEGISQALLEREYASWSNPGQMVARDLISYFWRFPAFFQYRTQHADTRRELIQLLGGECFETEGLRTPRAFREALERAESATAQEPATPRELSHGA